MSGAEVFGIVGLIGSIISIIDGTKKVHDAASNTLGLPGAFREVAAKLPLVEAILSSVRRNVQEGGRDENSYKEAKIVMEDCEIKAQNLRRLFQKVLPTEGGSRTSRYISAAKTLGKGSRVESLMEGILKDLQLLVIEHDMGFEKERERTEISEAIAEMAALSPSLQEHELQETNFSATHSGSGAINQTRGDQHVNSGSGKFYNAQTMNFGSDGKD